MKTELVAVIFREGGKFISDFLRSRPAKSPKAIDYKFPETPPSGLEEQPSISPPSEIVASTIETGCVPCAIGHFGTCTGILNESMRFARSDGMATNQVIDRVSHCLQELNALEREDLTSEKIVDLPEWEKDLAIEALEASRKTRHSLEGISTVDELERVVADTQTASTTISRKWFKQRLAKMPKEEKAQFAEKAIEKLEGE